MLVTHASGSPFAIVLSGQHRFAAFDCSDNDTWKGLLVPNVRIELDETSVFDVEMFYPLLGSVVRTGADLNIAVKEDGNFRGPTHKPLISDLPAGREKMAAGFTRWRVVIGEGPTLRTLTSAEIAEKPAD